MSRATIILAFPLALLAPLACSLSSFRPAPVQVQMRRNGPPLPAMDYYAVAISGGSLPSSLTSGNVLSRSLGCLGLVRKHRNRETDRGGVGEGKGDGVVAVEAGYSGDRDQRRIKAAGAGRDNEVAWLKWIAADL